MTSEQSKVPRGTGFRGALQDLQRRVKSFLHIKRKNRLDQKLVSRLNNRRIPSPRQFRYLGNILSAREKKVIGVLSLLILTSGVIFAYGTFFKDVQLAPKHGGEYTEGLVGSPLYLNPLLSQTNDVDQDLVRLVFNGLVRYDKDYQLIGDLAESWSVSEDQKQYTFTVRDGVKWHDGEPFTVNDVFFTFQLIKDRQFKSPLNISFEGVTAEITDEKKVTFTLQEPYSGFLHLMTFGILPQHLWYDIPSANAQLASYNQKPVGTGPYAFKSLLKSSNGTIVSYSFEAYEDYHLQEPYISRFHVKFYPDILSAVDALKNKNVQGLGYLPKEYVNEVAKRNITIYELSLSQFTAVFFNQAKNEQLKDDTVRKALRLATNKEALLEEVLQGQGNIIHTAILPGFVGHDESIIDIYDPVSAAELLTADGWAINELPLNPDGTVWEAPETEDTESDVEPVDEPIVPQPPTPEPVLVKDGKPLVVTLTTVEQPDSVKLVGLIKDQWEQIGVKVVPQIVDRRQFSSSTLPDREYQALVYGGIVGYAADPFPFWHSTQRDHPGVNLAGYVNRNVDTLIEEARQTSNLEVRAEKYSELQNLIADEVPAIFLYSPTYSYPIANEVKGIEINRINLPSDRFWTVSDWYIRTKKIFR